MTIAVADFVVIDDATVVSPRPMEISANRATAS